MRLSEVFDRKTTNKHAWSSMVLICLHFSIRYHYIAFWHVILNHQILTCPIRTTSRILRFFLACYVQLPRNIRHFWWPNSHALWPMPRCQNLIEQYLGLTRWMVRCHRGFEQHGPGDSSRDLFGMVKWPPIRGIKGHFESPGREQCNSRHY